MNKDHPLILTAAGWSAQLDSCSKLSQMPAGQAFSKNVLVVTNSFFHAVHL